MTMSCFWLKITSNAVIHMGTERQDDFFQHETYLIVQTLSKIRRTYDHTVFPQISPHSVRMAYGVPVKSCLIDIKYSFTE